MSVDEFKIKGNTMKYLLLTLLLSTQLFAYETNKPITLYGDVSEQVVRSYLTNKKENYYILNAHYLDKERVRSQPLQLIFDNNKKFSIPPNQLSQRYRVKGVILGGEYKNDKYVTPQIFKVSSIRKASLKLKASSYLNNYAYIKLLIDSPMVGKIEAKKRKIDIDYITNVKVKADDKLIYNVNLSPCISRDPFFKFAYKNIKPQLLTLEYKDNNVSIGTETKKVKHRNKIASLHKPLKLSKNPKSYSNQIESIKKLFGDITLIEDGIELTVAKYAENGGNIPINIRSNIKFKSIALFMGIGRSRYYHRNYKIGDFKKLDILCGEDNGYSFLSQWFSTAYSLANFNIRIKMKHSGEIIVILEAENGNFYTIKQIVQVAIAGGN